MNLAQAAQRLGAPSERLVREPFAL